MKLYKDGITMTVTIPSEIARYKDAGYVEVVENTVAEAAPVKGRKVPQPAQEAEPPQMSEQPQETPKGTE